MGYWSNASEGFDYKERYCARCAHNQEDKPCAVLEAHMLYNYKEANKKGSILHILIPRTANGLANDECRMFWPRDGADMTQERAGMKADQRYLEWRRSRANVDA